MDALGQTITAAVAAGVVSGGGFLLAAKMWVKQITEALNEGKEARKQMQEEVIEVANRVTKIEYQMTAIGELNATVHALHRRMDDHVISEGAQREKVARELGSLTTQVGTLSGQVSSALNDLPARVYAFIREAR